MICLLYRMLRVSSLWERFTRQVRPAWILVVRKAKAPNYGADERIRFVIDEVVQPGSN